MVHFKHRPDAILAGYLRTVLTSRQLHPPSEPGTDGHQTSKRLEFPVEATTLCVAGHPDVVLVAEDDHGASRPVWAHQVIVSPPADLERLMLVAHINLLLFAVHFVVQLGVAGALLSPRARVQTVGDRRFGRFPLPVGGGPGQVHIHRGNR
jgi:hypothetical protein